MRPIRSPLAFNAASCLVAVACLVATACTDPPATLPPDEEEDNTDIEDAGPVDAGAKKDTKKDTGGIKFDLGPPPDIPDTGPKDTKKPDTKKPDTKKPDVKKDTVKDTIKPPVDGDGGGDAVDPGDGSGGGDGGGKVVCDIGKKYCDKDRVMQCNATGTLATVVEDCKAKNGICSDASGTPQCKVGVVCDPTQAEYCDKAENAHYKCLDKGKKKDKVTQCVSGGSKPEICAKVGGLMGCWPKACEPGKWLCNGDQLTRCNPDGTAILPLKLAKGTDCAAQKPAALSCVVVNGTPKCEKPACGDGKVNQKDEECDDGPKNGGKNALCTAKCKKLDQSCTTAKDCANKLPDIPCLSHWQCLANQCIAIPSATAPCDDGNACTKPDTCGVQGGKFGCYGTPVDCGDDNICTTDTCDPKTGCKSSNNDSKPCDDGNKCTLADKCLGGTCQPGDSACNCKSDADCAAYDDGNQCNGTLQCIAGECKPDTKTKVTCYSGVCINPKVTKKDLCTKAKGRFFGGKCHIPNIQNKGDCVTAQGVWHENTACRAATCVAHLGFCIAKAKPAYSKCDDGNACSTKDLCAGGACTGAKVDCNDGNYCTDDSCDPKKGCVHKPNANACSDGDSCTSNDKCQGGTCAGTTTCECKSDKDCAGKDPSNKCLGSHFCKNNFCYLKPASIVKCSDKGTKCAPIACDPDDGKCKVVDPPGEGTPCTVDGDLCILDAVCKCGGKNCEKRTCEGKKATCDDGNACTADTCDPALGCVFKNNKAACSDDNPCTKGDVCGEGKCNPGKSVCTFCNPNIKNDCQNKIGKDSNKCTASYECSSAFKCIYKPTYVQCGPGTCEDPQYTTFDACTKAKKKWTDDNECTLTKCNPKSGKCEKQFLKSAFCDDNNGCTVNDHCEKGNCVTTARNCNDGDPCTLDKCVKDQTQGCVFDKLGANGKACEDGNKCTEGSTCASGFCVGGKPKKCNDGNSCTLDICDDKVGKCDFVSLGDAPCDNGDKCVADARCDAKTSACKVKKKLSCDKGNLCFDYSCDPKKGCVSLPNEVTCTSGNKCVLKAKCFNGGCQPVGSEQIKCDDGNVCTLDSCDPKQGCVTKASPKTPCSDQDACTEKDICVRDFDKQGNELGVCFGLKIDCNDENACTADSCDAKKGCQHKPVQGVCGAFAHCGGGAVPKCVFAGGAHIVISEIGLGGFGPSDDFIELYNASTLTTDLGDYEIQWRKPGDSGFGGWQTMLKLPKGAKFGPGQYYVAGNVGPIVGAIKADAVDKGFELFGAGMQVRIYDKSHTLQHDHVGWGVDACGNAAKGEGTAMLPWPGVGSWERKANKASTPASMSRNGKQWLAGNGYDTGNNDADFVHRAMPEPQPQNLLKMYEPACQQSGGNFTCGGLKPLCNYKGSSLPKSWGKDFCVEDKACTLGCGPGQMCEKSLGLCVADGGNGGRLVISEVWVGSTKQPGQFIELYNNGKAAINAGGLVVETKKAASGQSAAWDLRVATIPAGTVIPAGRYYLIASPEWVKKSRGGVDYLHTGSLGVSASGSAVHIMDPNSNVELDIFGFGSATKTYNSAPFPLQAVPDGWSLVRKAKSKATGDESNPTTMADGGKHSLLGNGVDTDNDAQDWTIRNSGPEPWSLASGKFKPACGGQCGGSQKCDFKVGASKCINVCGQCKEGASCNFRTGKCDKNVLISAYAAYGPQVKNGFDTITNTRNWFVELYNPGDTTVDMSGMLVQFRVKGSKFVSLTKPFPDGTCVLLKTGDKLKCAGKSPCECKGRPGANCKTDGDCQPMTIQPRNFALIVPFQYDPKLGKPDLRSHFSYSLDPDDGELRLVHQDGSSHKVFGPTMDRIEADLVAWGVPGLKYEKYMLQQLQKTKSCDGKKDIVIGEKCMMRRFPLGWPNLTRADVANPKHPAYYSGNGRQSDMYKDDDWARVCPRSARTSAATTEQP